MAQTEKVFTLKIVLMLVLFIVLLPFAPLLISARWSWWEAWVYALVCLGTFVISRALAARRNPDILAERGKFMDHADTQPWDKVLAPLLGLGGGLLPLTVGLEARFGTQPVFSLWLKLLALLLFLIGMVWASAALIENRFFSGTVRLQKERDQVVVSGGLYHVMRHPGYAGALLTYLVVPLFLQSWWAFLPAAFLLVVIVMRTRLEDRFLQANLPGYKEYARQVRYRLFPGIW